ncbi:hypothetical protein NMA58_08315 [Rhizobium sp. YTUHZ045]|uniref:hypothetical protein n=1 Tax=Rhizobium TaxID=379 RepID=UPI001C8293D7|nr:hypothetical protein [Rhizobium bangladeshense]MBX4884022.1 hypothetical protein [Rhizobium bangladeshense]
MPSQHSTRMRMPADWETARQRQQRQAADELAAYLARAATMRARIATARILISEPVTPAPGR